MPKIRSTSLHLATKKALETLASNIHLLTNTDA